MNNFAQELQTVIDKKNAWEAMGVVEKAVDIFVKNVKKELMAQASRGIEIDDMSYVVGGHSFDNIYAAFSQTYKCQHYPTDRQIQKFKALLGVRMLEDGLKFEITKDERTEIVTMRFTIYVNNI